MKIIDVLKLLESNKIIVILTPNKIEAKLVYDRFKLNEFVDTKIVDKNTLDVNGSKLIVTDPIDIKHTVCLSHSMTRMFQGDMPHVIVEFPQCIPNYVLNKIHAADVTFCSEELV